MTTAFSKYNVLHFELSGYAAHMLLDPDKEGFITLPFGIEAEFKQTWHGRVFVHIDAMMGQLNDAEDTALERITETHLIFSTIEENKQLNFYMVPRSQILTINVWTDLTSAADPDITDDAV